MESQPQNPEFRINPKNFTHAYIFKIQFCKKKMQLKLLLPLKLTLIKHSFANYYLSSFASFMCNRFILIILKHQRKYRYKSVPKFCFVSSVIIMISYLGYF